MYKISLFCEFILKLAIQIEGKKLQGGGRYKNDNLAPLQPVPLHFVLTSEITK